jgi:2-aminomuconate deaminase
MEYRFRIDRPFAEEAAEEIRKLDHLCNVVDYRGFPIDTGSIVAQKLLNPDNRFPVAMLSCSCYGDVRETMDMGRCLLRALEKQKKRAVVVLVSNFSNRYFTKDIDPREDHISSVKDDEWNQRILSFLERGAFDEALAEVPTFAVEAHADMGFKGLWWLAGLNEGASFKGRIFDYQAVYGTGAALVGLYPVQECKKMETKTSDNHISSSAPEAVGPYPHARREGSLLFLSGIGPRKKGSTQIPGAEYNSEGQIVDYDICIQTHSVFQNIKTILEECGCSLSQVIDCQVFLTNMKRDFADFNAVYREYFNAETGPTRTTIEVGSLPTPISVEIKVVASVIPTP